MAAVKKFPQSPYFDDFEEERNFLRVLFRPGFTVQTRELNQLQTILQDQIGIISDFALPDTSRVIGGETNLIDKLPFVKLAVAATLSRPLEEYRDASFVASNGVSGKIQFVVAADGSDPTTFYVSYESASSNGMAQVPADNSTITVTFESGVTEVLPVDVVGATGFAAAVILNEGIFYLNKNFVRTDRQLLLLGKYSPDIPEDGTSVGFFVTDEIVKPETDISLLDNSTGTTNETAPGAHRYKSTISLVRRDSLTDDQLRSYTELVYIINGEIAAKPRIDNEFAVLEQILARRTYDESGDYIVDDFIVDVREHLRTGSNGGVYTAAQGGDATKLALKFDDGVAYIRGFEVRTQGATILDLDKARTTNSASNAIIQTQYSNAVFCHDVVGYPILSAKLVLKDGASATVGTAYVRGVEYVGERIIASASKKVYRVDLVNVQFNAGKAWSSIASVAYDPSVSATYPFSAPVNDYESNARESSLVYALPYGFAQSIDPQVSFFYKEVSTTSVGATVTVSTGTSVETLDDEVDSYIVYADYDTGFTDIPQSVTPIDAQNVQLNIANIVGTSSPGNVPVRIIAKCFCTAPAIRSKTLVTSFANTGLVASARVRLTKADAYKLISVTTSGGVDVTDSYTLDTGARDSYYDFAEIVLKAGEAVPTGTLTVLFSYFEHAPAGDFFAPTSYSGIQYEDIPTYTTSTGEKIFLGSAVDYRQRRTSTNGVEKVGRHAFVTDDQLITDIVYYMGRNDRIMLTKRGEFIALKGQPSLTPQLPNEIADAITLYTINVPPYTFGPESLTVTKIDHRRYTMKDIAKLDTRLSNVEEVALLTSLEREVVAEDFDGRFKSGFVVDNFSNGNVADFGSPEFEVAIDMVNQEIRPKNVSTFVDVDVKNSSGVKIHGDGALTLDYTLKPLVSQLLASTTMRIQPLIRYDWVGDMQMTPSSDIWFDSQEVISTQVVSNVFFQGWLWSQSVFNNTSVTNTNTFDGSLLAGTWNFVGGVWRNASTGAWSTPEQNSQLNSIAARSAGNSGTITVGQNQLAVPFIRSRSVFFIASGLKPGARVYPSFDGIDVSANVQPAGGTMGSAIIVGGNGIASGSFWIPPATFRTGARVFKLSDNADPRGEYTSTAAFFTYTAQGTLIQNVVSASATSNTFIWRDPVAQSFFVEDSAVQGGCYVPAIDVYFGPVIGPNIHDVTVEIRRMVNGYPAGAPISTNAVARVAAASVVGSLDASIATRFTFQSPVYLPAGEEYAFVILSNSEKLSVWCSELGRRAYRAGDTLSATGEIIAKQPYLGSMFVSQNSTTWSTEQTKDVKFVIHRASFASSGYATFNNKVDTENFYTSSNIHRRKLQNNALYFTSGSNQMYISGWGHGFSVGDSVYLTNDTASGSYFGVPVSSIFNQSLLVSDVDVFGVYVTLPSAATATGRQGGNNTYAFGWVVDYSYAQLISDDLVLENTLVNYNLVAKRKDAYTSQSDPIVLVPDNIVDLGSMFAVKASGDDGVLLTANMFSGANNLSPMIMTSRVGVNVISNVVNDTPLLSPLGAVQDDSSPARYVQKQVTLLNPANELRVYVNANIPASTSINVYYKVGQGSANEQAQWIKMPQDGALQYTGDPSKFYQQKFVAEFGTEFQAFTVMVEMVSSDKTRVPRIKDYRALALNA